MRYLVSNKIDETIRTLEAFKDTDYYYWLRVYGAAYGLTDAEKGFVIAHMGMDRRTVKR